MRQPKTLKEGLYTILKLNGAFNMKAATLLQAQSYSSTASTLTKLRERDIIARNKGLNYFPHLYSIERMWKRSVAEELRDVSVANENREHYKCEAQTTGGRSRLAGQSEVMAMMIKCQINVVNQWEYGYKNFYVAARKIKTATNIAKSDEENRVLARAKVAGTYRQSEALIYNVYATKDMNIKWDRISENKYIEVVKDISENETGEEPEVKAVLLSQSIDSFEELMRKQSTKKREKENNNVIVATRLYEEILVVKRSIEGTRVLELLKTEGLKEMLNEYVYKERAVGNNIADKIEKTEQGNLISLNFMYPDIVKLRKFILYRSYQSNGNDRFEIHCFKEYEEGLKKLAGDQIEIKAHEVTEIEKWIKGEE